MRTSLSQRTGIVVFGAFVAALVASTGEVRANNGVDVPLAGTMTASPCVPPGAYTKGHLKITARFTTNLNGMHISTDVHSCGSKIVTPIGEFVANEIHSHDTNIGFHSATEYTIHDSFKYTSPGSRENYRMYVMMHVTINANGEVTARVEKIHIDCYEACCITE